MKSTAVSFLKQSMMTASDALKLRWIHAAELSPDGTRLIAAISYVSPDGRSDRFQLEGVSLDDPSQVTTLADDSVLPWPAWAPDGEQVAYVRSDSNHTPQLWVTSWRGGDNRQLTRLPRSVIGRPQWSPDGRVIAFGARSAPPRDPMSPRRIRRATYRFDGLGYVDEMLADIFVAEVETGRTTRLTSDGWMNGEPKWSGDGRRLMYLASFPPDAEWDFAPTLRVIDLTSGDVTPVVADWGGVISAEWLTHGDIAFIGFPRGNPFVTKYDVWVVEMRTNARPTCRTASSAHEFKSRLQSDVPPMPRESLLRVAADGSHAFVGSQRRGTIEILKVALRGEERIETITSGDRSCWLLDAKRELVLFIESDLHLPNEIKVTGADGSGERRVTHINDALTLTLPLHEVVRLDVQAADGLVIEAWLMKPLGQKPPYPTILYLHGGPHAAVGHAYSIDFQLLASAGYAVLFPNYRGSSGYGFDFMAALDPDQGARGLGDHLAAIDKVVADGLADPQRLGLYGISAGGLQAAWLLGHTERFKAAVLEDAITNLTSFFGTADTAVARPTSLDLTPYAQSSSYRDNSPTTYAARCQTPTLLIVCEDDLRVTTDQAEQFYRALRTAGCAVEMLRLPGASHVGSWKGPPQGRHAQNEALLEWYGRFLLSAADSELRSR